MPRQSSSREGSHEVSFRARVVEFIKNLPDLIIEFRSILLFVGFWLIVGQIAGQSLYDIARRIGRLLLYPFQLILFQTEFDDIFVPEIFILLIPFVAILTVGLAIIIITED